MIKMKRKSNGKIRSFLLGAIIAGGITYGINMNAQVEPSCDRVQIATEELAYVLEGYTIGYPAPMPQKPSGDK